MPAFLTQQWADEATSAAKTLTGGDLTIQYVVSGAPSGEIHYWTKLSGPDSAIGIGDAPGPDVTFTQDYETAVESNRGDLLPQAAFMQGRLKITGNMGKVLKQQDVVSALQEMLAGLPTDY